MEEYDLFISCAWGSYKQEVIDLDNELKEKSYKTYMDSEVVVYNGITDIINEGIEKSKMFLCCLKKEYLNCANRMMELNVAFGLQKPILWILFEDAESIDYKTAIQEYSKVDIYLEDCLFLKASERDLIMETIGKVLSATVRTIK